MSRHRNIRSLRYAEECDGYDDVYGRSLDEDLSCISPTDAHFIYDRGRAPGAAAFWPSSSISNSSEQLDNTEPEKLQPALNQLKELLEGSTHPEEHLISTLLRYDYNVQRSLNSLLDIPPPPKIVLAGKPAKNTPKTIQNFKILELPEPSAPEKESKTYPNSSRTIQNTKILEVPEPSAPDTESKSPSSDQSELSSNLAKNLRLIDDPDVAPLRSGKESRVDPMSLYASERGSNKEHLYIVVVGHVDAGKSTLIGRLLCDLGEVSQRTLHKYEQESKKVGKQSFAYAWVMDETGEERLRGITMDIGRVQFNTKSKCVTVLDAPGHADFIPNMISGAGQADVALLVVDATRGEFESGFELGGQTREHALLVRSLGINQLAVAVNKLDTTNWSRERFDEICSKLRLFLKQAGFKENDVTYLPLSGLADENLVKPPSDKTLAEWYKGPCLIDVIDGFKSPERPVTKPFRMSVNDIYKGTGSGFCIFGKIETGLLNVGDKVSVCPLRETATVKTILINDVAQSVAFAGDHVGVVLLGFDIQNVSVGNILCDPSFPVRVTTRFEAQIVVFNVKVPITKGYPVIMHHQSLAEAANIVKLKSSINKSTGEVIKKKPRCLGNNSVALVEIEVSRPICIEVYKEIKELGRIMLRVSGVTVAAGLVTAVVK